VRLDQDQIIQAVAEYAVRHKLVEGGSLVDVRLRVVDGDGKPVSIVLMGDDRNPVFVADLTDFGEPSKA